MGLFSSAGGGSVGTGFVPIKPDTEGFGNDLEAGLDKEAGPAAERSGQKTSRVFKAAFAAGAALITKSVIDFSGFERGMNEVFTLLPGISGDAMSEMTEQVKDFSVEFGVLPDKVVPALYQSLSAGVPKDNVFTFMTDAVKLAKGGATEMETAVDGLSSVVNAYGTDVLSSKAASDAMFTTVKLGKTTIEELSGALFNVTPTAAALGVQFGDVSAALAAMTLQGVPTSVATTQLRQLLVELSKDGSKTAATFEKMSGKTFREFIASGGNLQNAISIIDDAAVESGVSISDMFGSVEAGSAALTLTGKGAETFHQDLLAMADSAGATDAAFDTMNKGLGATFDKLKAKFSVVLLNIGEAIAPTVGAVGQAVGGMLELFSKLPGPMQAVAVLLGTITAGLFAFAKPILNGIRLFGKLNGVFSALAANPWVLVLAGLVLVTVLIIKNWTAVKETVSHIWQGLQFEAKALGDAITGIFRDVATVVSGIFGSITSTIGSAISTVGGFFAQLGSDIAGVFSSIGSTIAGAVSFITSIPETIGGAFSTLADIISAPFRAAFGAIKAAWNSTVGGFGFTTPDWIPFLGGKSFRVPMMAGGGVLSAPQLLMAGEYPGASRNPEIVAPQNVIRETMVQAMASAPAARGVTVTITGNQFHVRQESDIDAIALGLGRRIERESMAQGRPALIGTTR